MKQPVTKDPARRLAAAVCAVETIAMVGLGVFYLLQLSNAADQARVATEAVLILLTAAGLGLLTRLWLADHSPGRCLLPLPWPWLWCWPSVP